MSRSTMAVLFPDGTIRYGIYNGTCGNIWPRLFDSQDEAWAEKERTYDTDIGTASFYPPDDFDRSLGEEVQIYTDWKEWTGRATREFVTSEWNTWADEFYGVWDRPPQIEVTRYAFDDQPVWLDWESGPSLKGMGL